MIKVDALEISEEECDEEIIYEVVTFYSDKIIVLGCYKTKERALEVLDEIQSLLRPQEYNVETTRGTYTSSTNISTYVYEMPKE